MKAKSSAKMTTVLAGDVEALCSILARIVARIVKEKSKGKIVHEN